MARAKPKASSTQKPARSPKSDHVRSKRRRKGRPSKVEQPTIVDEFFRLLDLGNYVNTAARAAGLDPSTVGDWVRKGDAGDPEYIPFATRYRGARERAETRAVDQVRRHAVLDPPTARWFLERSFQENWGRRDQLKLSGSLGGAGGPAVAENAALLAAMTDEELEQLERVLAPARARVDAARVVVPKGVEESST